MSFDMDKVKAIVAPVAIKANDITRDLNDRFDDVSEPVKSLIAVAVPTVALTLLSGGVAGVVIGVTVAFRLFPTVADRFFPATIVTDTVVEPVVEVVSDAVGDDDRDLGFKIQSGE